MQLVTLTAPDGHQERWDFKTTYLSLLTWYQYLKDVDNAKEPNDLGTRISKFVGDDINQVHTLLIYLDGFNDNLYSKLSMLTKNDNKNTVRLYFIMKSINNPHYLRHNKEQEPERQQLINRIKQVTNNDSKTLNRLTELTKLFVDGQLSYKHLEECN